MSRNFKRGERGNSKREIYVEMESRKEGKEEREKDEGAYGGKQDGNGRRMRVNG